MPGLQELEYFRDELSNLGHEREITAERGEAYVELPLPETGTSAPQIDVNDLLADIGVPEESAPDAGASPLEPGLPAADQPPPDFSGFEDLLSGLSLDFPESVGAPAEPAKPALPETEEEPAELAPAELAPAGESFSLPDDLLAGFATDIEGARAEAAETAVPSGAAPGAAEEAGDLGDLGNLGDLGDFGDPGSFGGMGDLGDLGNLGDLDDSGNLGDLGDLGAPEDFGVAGGFGTVGPEDFGVSGELPPDMGEPADAGLSSAEAALPAEMDFTPDIEKNIPDAPAETFTLPDLGVDFGLDLGSPGIPGADLSEPEEIPVSTLAEEPEEVPQNPFGGEFEDMSIPDDLNIAEPEAAAEEIAPLDGFDGFSIEDDFLNTSIASGGTEADEFHIPGFSDFTGTSKVSQPVLAPEPGRRSAKKEIPLSISEGDFRTFLDILAHYPLNLRLAIEEYLSGDEGTELQKMGLVHDMLSGTPIRKIARTLESVLSRNIPIPKDFEKKSVEEYEKEKTSLRYVLINRILPIAFLFTLVAVMTACVSILFYQFVWQPLVAESLYKQGYGCIEDARYARSLELFDEAVSHFDKKRWYFRYARAYRAKKQFINAEGMYERILDHFNNDRIAGLEYAEMLRVDLRNFEKAETILRRRLLDHFVNDSDGLMALGDTYLDWAEEDPSKYEEAKKCYSTLISLYGRKDQYLVGMLRYFIRTDKLGEVLPLKDHFLGKKAKIGARDLVELGGYLLEKRYNPKKDDSEALRARIEDLRKVLDRAIKADDTIPEAHYYLGRFFIYNYRNDLARPYLSQAIVLFDHAESMTAKRVLLRVDAYRLLGEVLVANKEFLKAREYYRTGIALYEAQRAARSVPRDPLVGTLYADHADIDYFVSGDLSAALLNYRKALNEMADTPSVRYRIGYILYHDQDYEGAMDSFLRAYEGKPSDRNLLYSFGNALFRRGDYYAAQGQYERLLDLLEAERSRRGITFAQVKVEYGVFLERYLRTANNLAVALDRIAGRTGDSARKARALELLAESTRAWDALTRNPQTMVRPEGSNLAVMNIQNMTHPRSTFAPEIYADISRTLEGERPLSQTGEN